VYSHVLKASLNEDCVIDQKLLQINYVVLQYLYPLFFEDVAISKAPTGVHNAVAVCFHYALCLAVNIVLLTQVFLAL
jgi:hypothetical protein